MKKTILIVVTAMLLLVNTANAQAVGNTQTQQKVTHVKTKLSTAEGKQIKRAVDKYSKLYNVDKTLIHAVIMTESMYNPRAVSSQGCSGLMQLAPSTFRARQVGSNIYDIDQNIHGGVKNISGGYGQCGNIIQDIAAIKSLEELTNEYLIKNGYEEVFITTVLHQWMGSFPQDEAKAFGVIALGSTLAALSKATKVIVKTPHEAIGVPTMEANAQGLRCTKQILSMLKDQEFNNNEVEIEKEIIKKETRCILDKCFEIGENDIALGVIRAFKGGILDIPFAPSIHTMGKILPARDNNGAIRILNPGQIPFTDEIIDFNNKKIEERARYENREKSFQMVIDDVYAISKGTLIGRPRNK